MGVVSALFTLLYVGAKVFLLFSNMLLPLPVVIIDAILLLFWIMTVGGFGDSWFLKSDCKFSISTGYTGFSGSYYTIGTSPVCSVSKATFTFALFSL